MQRLKDTCISDAKRSSKCSRAPIHNLLEYVLFFLKKHCDSCCE